MNASFIDTVLALAVFGLVVAKCNYLWRKAAIDTARRWSSTNGITLAEDVEFIFKMGRPAKIEFEGVEHRSKFWYTLRLYAGPLSPSGTAFGVWGRVELHSKSPN